MIDLHTHILPGLDDGSLDLEDSLAMARVAASDGIAVACATPHVRGDHDVRIEELPQRIGDLQQALDDAEIELRVAPGGEVSALVADSLSDAHLGAIALGGGDWVLLEPAPGPITSEFAALVERLARARLSVGRRASRAPRRRRTSSRRCTTCASAAACCSGRPSSSQHPIRASPS